MTPLIRILQFSVCILAIHTVSAQTLPIYVAPATDHAPVARASISGKAIAKATPVLEAARKAEGWYWAEYSGPFEGYIATRDFGDGDRPRLGSIVYSEPRVNSLVVTTIEEGDQGSMANRRADGAFVRITLNKTIGVYFNARLSGVKPPEIKNTYVRRSPTQTFEPPARVVQPPPVVVSAPPPPTVTPAPKPAPKKEEPAPHVRREVPKTIPAPAQPKPKPAPTPVVTPAPKVETPRPQVQPVAVPKPAPKPKRSPPREPEVLVTKRPIPLPPVVIDNSITLSGKLLQTKRRWLLFKPETPYMLVDNKGERIAWVDLEGSVLARPLPELLGAEVAVYGEWRKLEDSAKMILQARNVRLAL